MLENKQGWFVKIYFALNNFGFASGSGSTLLKK